MEIKNIHYQTSGFLNDASYTSDLSGLLEEYKDSFTGAESLVLNLDEIIVGTKPNKDLIVFSQDGKEVEINITEWRSRDRKKSIEHPNPASIYTRIRFALDKAVKEYAEQYPDNI